MNRRPSRTLARASWAIGDQILSSATNFALGVLVARFSASAEEFGAFSLVFSTYLVLLTASRAIGSQPLAITASHVEHEIWKKATRDSTGTCVVLGVAGGGLLALAGLVVGGSGWLAVLFGVGMVGLLVQDGYRYALVASGSAFFALLSELAWVVAMAVLLGLALVVDAAFTPSLIVAVWVGGAWVGAAVGLIASRALPNPSTTRSWVTRHRALIPGILVTNIADTAILAVRQYALAAVAGLAVVGALRAGQLVLSPVFVLHQGISLVAVPEMSRIKRDRPRQFVRRLVQISVALGAGAAVAGVIALIIPVELGRAVLGTTWDAARPVLLPLALAMILNVGNNGAGIGLLVLGAATRLARLTVWTKVVGTVLVLIAGVAAGAVGAAWAMVAEFVISSIAHWRSFGSAYAGSTAGEGAMAEPEETQIADRTTSA